MAQLVYQTMDWSKQPRALPHFTNGHLFCLFLTASVPQKDHHSFSFRSSTMLLPYHKCNLTNQARKGEPTGRKNRSLGTSLCCVKILGGETPFEGPSIL